MTDDKTYIESKSAFYLREDIKFFGLVFQEINDYSPDFQRNILIAFRKSGLNLHRFTYLHPKVIRHIRRLEHKFGWGQKIKYNERFD